MKQAFAAVALLGALAVQSGADLIPTIYPETLSLFDGDLTMVIATRDHNKRWKINPHLSRHQMEWALERLADSVFHAGGLSPCKGSK